MHVRHRKLLIWLAAAATALAGVAVLAWGLATPTSIVIQATGAPNGAIETKVSSTNESSIAPAGEPARSLDELRQLCELNLRGPLYDSAPADGAVGDQAQGVLAVRLIGTANEPGGHSVAVFQKSDGSVELCREGQSFKDAAGAVLVVKIEHQKATVRHGGESRVLVVVTTP